MTNLKQQGRTIFDLDSTEISNLVLIAENSTGTAGAQAKGILEYAYGYHYCKCLPDNTLGLKNSTLETISVENDFVADISIEPNPSVTWAAFNYTLPSDKSKGVIEITDISGKLIDKFTIKGKQGQKIWDTGNVLNGVYFYTLNTEGYIKSGKIIVNH